MSYEDVWTWVGSTTDGIVEICGSYAGTENYYNYCCVFRLQVSGDRKSASDLFGLFSFYSSMELG